MTYDTYYDRYKELKATYKIACLYNHTDGYDDSQYDIVIEYVGAGYAHSKYKVLKNTPNLSWMDLAIICDCGNLCYGWRIQNGLILVHED